MSSACRSIGRLQHLVHEYGSDHGLQKLSVWLPASCQAGDTSKYWVIYIHGGAWRDPRQNRHTFLPTIAHLHRGPTERYIAAFASLDYRLSPHPDFPQDVASTPPQRLRNAKHPAHMYDVHSALAFLQKTYDIADRYILVGHSCGATLAFQTVMEIVDPSHLSPGSGFVAPTAIVGVAGIYDLRLLRDNHARVPAYQAFLCAAFGPDEALWDHVSPARHARFEETWGTARKVVALASSAGDELVEGAQLGAMKRQMDALRLRDPTVEVVARDGKFEGTHDAIWERGEGVAEMVALVINLLV